MQVLDMATIRYKKRGNKFYAYEIHQYWDKELKKPRQKTKYLGVSNTDGGDYSKPGRGSSHPKLEKEILDCGDSLAILETAKSIGLDELIKNSFDDWDSIMNLLIFQMVEGSAMQYCKEWSTGNIVSYLFAEAKTSSQDISRLISRLGEQSLQTKFFKNYTAKFFSGARGLLIDYTALPSSINSSINAFGYSSGNIEQNVTCLMLVDKESSLPIYFRAIGVDIADISTVKTTIAEIKKLGLDADSAILDAGFCSKENLQFMCAENIDFITMLPKSHKIFSEMIAEIGNIESFSNVCQYGERTVFIKSIKKNIYGNDLYAHIILDPSKKNKDIQYIFKNKLVGVVAPEEQSALDAKMKEAGFFILLSKRDIKHNQILPSYYAGQKIEEIFGFAKSNNNILPLRVHSEKSIKGYLMLVFLALIIFITMKQRLQQPMDKIWLTLRSLKAKVFDEEIIIQENNKKVKDIFLILGIIMPIKLGV